MGWAWRFPVGFADGGSRGVSAFSVGVLLFAWLPVAFLLFSRFKAARAAALGVVLGWLFLPAGEIDLAGLPALHKHWMVPAAVALAGLARDPARFFAFRPRWHDLPIFLWCSASVPSSLANGLGLYDGVSAAFNTFLLWGVPYLIGRLYFTDLRSLRVLAESIVLGAVLYVPLCLYEIRMSPVLHLSLYGYSMGYWSGSRMGGWRPQVFLDSGLALVMFMSTGAVLAWSLFRGSALRHLQGVPIVAVNAVLLPVFFLCKGVGAIGLFALAVVSFEAQRLSRLRWVLVGVLLLTPLYYAVRLTGTWHGEPVTTVASMIFGDAPAGSFAFRLEHEAVMTDRAMQRPLFGWGGWGRFLVVEEGGWTSVPDGYWVIAFGQNGAFGLVGFTGVLLLPALRYAWRVPGRVQVRPEFAAATGFAFVLGITCLDNLMNAMFTPLPVIAAGGLAVVVDRCVRGRSVGSAGGVRLGSGDGVGVGGPGGVVGVGAGGRSA